MKLAETSEDPTEDHAASTPIADAFRSAPARSRTSRTVVYSEPLGRTLAPANSLLSSTCLYYLPAVTIDTAINDVPV